MDRYLDYQEKLKDIIGKFQKAVDNKSDIGENIEWVDNISIYRCYDDFYFRHLKSLIRELYLKFYFVGDKESYCDRAPISENDLIEKITEMAKGYDKQIQELKHNNRTDYKVSILKQIKQICAKESTATNIDDLLNEIADLATNYQNKIDKDLSREIRAVGNKFVAELAKFIDKNLSRPYKKYCLEQELKELEEYKERE